MKTNVQPRQIRHVPSTGARAGTTPIPYRLITATFAAMLVACASYWGWRLVTAHDPYETMMARRLVGVPFDADQPIHVWRHGEDAEVTIVLYPGRAASFRDGDTPARRAIPERDLKISTPFASIMAVPDATDGVPWLETDVDGETLTTSSLAARMHVDAKGIILHVLDTDQLRYHRR